MEEYKALYGQQNFSWERKIQSLIDKEIWDKALALLFEHKKNLDKAFYVKSATICRVNHAVYLQSHYYFKQALILLNDAQKDSPMNPFIYNNMGNVYKKMHQYEQALKCYSTAVAMKPDYAMAYCNLSQLYHWLGLYDEEKRLLEHALKLEPERGLIHWNYGILLLLLGNYQQGFLEQEYRFEYDRYSYFKKDSPEFREKYWDGRELDETQRLVIFSEQGFGDCIQFYRFLVLLKQRVKAKIILTSRKELHTLLLNSNSVAHCFDEIDIFKPKNLKAYDYHFPLSSLPVIFESNLDTVPKSVPYLFVEDGNVKQWKKIFNKRKSNLKIGFCCSGRSINQTEKFRTVSMEQFALLFEESGIDWYNLQIEDKEQYENHNNVFNIASEIKDFHDTAAIIKNLDLVITIETSVAHLCGALGSTAWVMLTKYPPWRWLLDREDSPWYPSLKLYRQRKQMDWEDVIHRIRKDLIKFKQTQKGVRHG